jgi:hypothetical protein
LSIWGLAGGQEALQRGEGGGDEQEAICVNGTGELQKEAKSDILCLAKQKGITE